MSTETKIKLFKIASEINIGKDAIVDFLVLKGFQIENKPTATLNSEMLDAIYEKFKKEKKAAEKQREKIQKHKIIRKPSEKELIEAKSQLSTGTQLVEAIVEDTPPAHLPQIIEKETVEADETQVLEKEVETELEIKEAGREAISDKIEAPQITEQTKDFKDKKAKSSPSEKIHLDTELEKTIETLSDDQVMQYEFGEVIETESKEQKIQSTEDESIDLIPTHKRLKIVGRIDLDKDKKQKDRGKPSGKIFDKKETRVEIKEPVDQPVSIKKKVKGLTDEPLDIDQIKIDEKRKRKRKKHIREAIKPEEVTKAIKKTIADMEDHHVATRTKKRLKKKQEREERELKLQQDKEKEAGILELTEFVTTSDLGNLMGVSPNDIILKCIQLGLYVTINQRLDKETIIIIADDYGYDVEFVEQEILPLSEDYQDEQETLQPRPPIVTIMGHVDHGKTSLLDYIRHTNVVAGEAGGITQHIGAYMVTLADDKSITFLDTPGHEAFTAMRARGAQVTDIVVLVVAADDSVMPQTLEAISHALAANVPIIVAMNKIDKPDARPDRIKQQLADHNILIEEWGGKYQYVEISAKFGKNIDLLLEKILLEAELLDLKANPNRKAIGTIIESNMSKGLGTISTVIVQKGTLRIGDPFVAGAYCGRVRAMFDERNNRVEYASPSTPVSVIGFDGLPEAGDLLVIVSSDSEAKTIANQRQQLRREQELRQLKHLTLDEISRQIQLGGIKELKLIVKGDVMGSVEALRDSLIRLSRDEVRVVLLHYGVGSINESDIMLAKASGAVIIGFQVSPTPKSRKLAEKEAIDIRQYDIIYDCINEIELALEGLLSPEIKEEITSTVEIRKVFKISKMGNIAGCYVLSGKISRNDRIRVLRDGLPVFTGTLSSLKRNKEDAKEVDQGYECGIQINGFNDIKEGDIIEGFKTVEIKRKFD